MVNAAIYKQRICTGRVKESSKYIEAVGDTLLNLLSHELRTNLNCHYYRVKWIICNPK